MQVERVRIRTRSERLSSVVNYRKEADNAGKLAVIGHRSDVLEMILLLKEISRYVGILPYDGTAPHHTCKWDKSPLRL